MSDENTKEALNPQEVKSENRIHAMEMEKDLAPKSDEPTRVASSSGVRKVFNVSRLRIISFICNTLFLAIAIAYIVWWPNEMPLDRLAMRKGSVVDTITTPTRAPTTGEEMDRVQEHIQTWQVVYLCIAVIMSYYGAFVGARGPLLISMMANIGLLALFQWWNFSRGWPFAMFCTFLAMANACASFLLSERVQEEAELLGIEQQPRTLLSWLPCTAIANFRMPEIDVYHFGQIQMLASCALVSIGFLSWMTHETMLEPIDLQGICRGWPESKCKAYYGTEIETTMTVRLAVQMAFAGAVGIIGTYLRHRTALILAFTLTILPFTGCIQASYQVLFTRENVNYLCDYFPDDIQFIWGENFNCEKEKYLQNVNVLLLALSSVASALHFFTTIRFSEKLQCWEDAKKYDIDTNLGDEFHVCWLTVKKPARLYTLCMIFGCLFQFASGITQIVYAVKAKDDETIGILPIRPQIFDVVTLDDPWYREAPIIYGVWALISAICMGIHPWIHSRTMLSITTIILIETLLLGINIEVWHYNDLHYGIDGILTDNIGNHPIYVGGDARDIVQASANAFSICNIATAFSIFFTILASESIQDERRMHNTPITEDTRSAAL